ncbi:hypothetical protein QEO76_gp29 [Arthrobacter phage Cole]|uniref:Uncharacterized protein n=1 Tax=Arthrobacter phage Cole TaxID=2944951 RepID=A0A9E7J7S3_9CAUD|nr:hypothetical protein QEO76_gp29 [Arthrobacter phage Cole]URC18067.1 hypothetical protein SEA_COLE_29 [Arthrobacter phage Cole]
MSILDVPGLTPGTVAEQAADPDSPLGGVLSATYALKSEVPPTTLDGGNATSTYDGSFNFDGGSAA